MRSYLERLKMRMAERGLRARLLLVQSNGGVCSPEIASDEPVRLLLSGPSGGALAAQRACRRLDRPNLVGIDMGGTSFDVCIVQDGGVASMTQGEIDGLPVRLPMIEIRTIGAGGGSIASVDSGGRLTVGPRSAGARPGPVCYGRGGTQPTVTDANLVLGRLDAEFFLGGALVLDVEGARAAVEAQIARPLHLNLDRAAEGILTLTNAGLASAIRLSLFEKGLDPRAFSLLSFGGAGGLHAIPVAEELGIDEVIFPADASTFSASGILHSDIVHDLAKSRVMRAVPESLPALGLALEELRRDGASLLEQDGVPGEARELAVSVDMRYLGQAFELVVPWSDAQAQADALERLIAGFHALHRQRFSYANPGDPVEIVTLRVTAIGRLPRIEESRSAATSGERGPLRRRVFLDGAWHEIDIRHRAELRHPIAGPALIEEEYTTVFVARGWNCGPGPGGDLLARRSGAAAQARE
ncbi:MAG TPA: hydantoinase/oxoprolinase family protein [Beijerinckiaceae bacterium]|nr:hydantoinase/oxoprolinase family protein [Beijerinckiaceae bacterium]